MEGRAHDHLARVDREQRVGERLGRLRLRDHATRPGRDRGLDLRVGDRPRVDDHRADLGIARQLPHPLDPVPLLPVRVEQRDVDALLRVRSDVELDHTRRRLRNGSSISASPRSTSSKSFTRATLAGRLTSCIYTRSA